MSDIKYQAVIDLAERNNSHTLLHELAIEDGRAALRILEVGCSSGYLGASLVAKGHHVTGVEPDAGSAQAAAAVLPEVWHGGLDDYLAANPQARFDVLVFGDVLEHMVDPAAALRRALAHLAPGGSVVISVPNVTNGAVRAMLLDGRFEYQERGILDVTHLRFFSRTGVARLLADAGLATERLYQVILPAAIVDAEYGMQLRREMITAVELLDDDESRHAFQFVLRARPSDMSQDALLAKNAAVAAEMPVKPRRPRGSRSPFQKTQAWLFRVLLRSISARRFR